MDPMLKNQPFNMGKYTFRPMDPMGIWSYGNVMLIFRWCTWFLGAHFVEAPEPSGSSSPSSFGGTSGSLPVELVTGVDGVDEDFRRFFLHQVHPWKFNIMVDGCQKSQGQPPGRWRLKTLVNGG